ncbi:MAG: response regulator, partial [Bacteroidales bacterium]|nr:response regulator [Bacteroidales bacterium]
MKTQTSILVIDDEPIVCESFKKILSNEGYKVETKSHPRDGLKLATSHAYDLVFLDLIMEEMDGMELFENLREKDPDVPVVIVTGYPSMSTAIESVRLRASDYILKPFTPEEILKSVDNVLRQKDMLDKDVKTRAAKHLEILEWEPACKPFRFYESAWLQQGKDGSVR